MEDRTQKIKEYENIVSDLQDSLSIAHSDLRQKDSLNETLLKEKSQLKLSLMGQKSSKSKLEDNQRENEIAIYKTKV